MSVYEVKALPALLAQNTYPGRGIVIGKTANGKSAAIAYFIMGRSENSRNRVFIETENSGLMTAPFDEAKVSDPSLIIYHPIRKTGNNLVVTNGDQTDTVYEAVKAGGDFKKALETRAFEPDAPNFTPRISGMLTFEKGDFTYQMSILKSADEVGNACNRYTFTYAPIAGVGQFLHTYNGDGNPIPTFTGEPERVAIPDDIDTFANGIWQNLNPDNKISLYVRFVDLATGAEENRLFNKNV